MKYRFLFPACLIFLLTLVLPGQVLASTPSEVRALARAGAPELALSMIRRFQPPYQKMRGRWAAWEQLNLEILASEERWQDIIDRVAAYPSPLTEAFYLQAHSLLARAHLHSGDPVTALGIYRKLLWRQSIAATDQDWRNWRLGVIRAYIAMDGLEQALIAWRRFEQDYPDLDVAELELRARLAMQAGQPDEAVEVLAALDDPEAKPVLLLAQLEAGKLKPKKIITQAMSAAEAAEDGDNARLWWVAALAARAARDGRGEIEYLQRALQEPIPREKDPLFPLDAERLWDAYLAFGEYLGNQKGLLVGDDEAWIAQAAEEKEVLEKSAYLAVTALEGQTQVMREQGHGGLMQLLIESGNSTALLSNLYLHSANFPTIDYIPEVVRPLLAEAALERGDHQLTSRLMQGISKPPEGADSFDWSLRLARIHILGGNEELGIDVLYGILVRHRTLEKKQVDRFLQVLFDLQTLKHDKEAIALFNALQPRLTESRQQRELLFWMADSYKSLGQAEQAGYLYLKSAIFVDGTGLDPWGQTARFFAAESLAEAGLIRDARHLYRGLLRVAQDANRKIVLHQRLQQLQLME